VPDRHPEQPVIHARIVLGAEPARVELVLPPVRRSAAAEPARRAPSKPPPIPPKRER
jgi:hypothetical protein